MLIPKKQAPYTIVDFQPISLCDVTYKLITRVITNGFPDFLPLTISDSQSTLTPCRLITYNILIVFELLHAIRYQYALMGVWP